MRQRWCMFEHPVRAPIREGREQRGIRASHLADMEAPDLPAPACGAVAEYVNSDEPSGFILACVRCLAMTDGRP